MMKHEKWMEMDKKIDEIWMNNGWQWMKNWVNIDEEKKKGWKMDGNWMEMVYRACVKWFYKNWWAGIKQN